MSERAWLQDVTAPQGRAAGGGGASWGGPSVPGAPPPLPVNPQGNPWYYVPAELRSDIILTGRANIDGAVTTTWVPVATQTLTGNAPGVLRSLYFIAVGTITAATRVDCRVTLNGSPIRGWDVIPIASVPATSSTIAYGPDETFIILEPGATFQLEARVSDGLVYDVQLGAKGWQR